MRPHGSGSSPARSRSCIPVPKNHRPQAPSSRDPHPFFRGKWDPDTLFFTCLINCQMAKCPRCLDAQVHSRLCPLDSRCKIRGSYLLSHDFFCFHLYPLHVFIRHFSVPKSAYFVSSRLRFYFFPPDRSDTSSGPSFSSKKSFFFLFFLYDAVQSRIIAGRVLHLLLQIRDCLFQRRDIILDPSPTSFCSI